MIQKISEFCNFFYRSGIKNSFQLFLITLIISIPLSILLTLKIFISFICLAWLVGSLSSSMILFSSERGIDSTMSAILLGFVLKLAAILAFYYGFRNSGASMAIIMGYLILFFFFYYVWTSLQFNVLCSRKKI
ncbi:MAG: hypothetical protein AUJ18_01170 [Candidatus Hydrogenedentes bacterium CG1_02_42_14]|nr:MAG: hypothetical protein AUJ18_01170 [Candidatus Hydrogenedentes bacterium CG1_02_42_14]